MPTTTATATCERCNGTGQYHGTRRDGSSYIGRCFACQGYAYQPNRAAYNRAFRSHRTGTVAAPAVAVPSILAVPAGQPVPPLGTSRGVLACQAFNAAYPAEYAWLASQAQAGVEFAASLLSGLQRYGNLTPRQLAAVQRNLGQVELVVTESVTSAAQLRATIAEPTIGTGLDGQPVAAESAQIDNVAEHYARIPAPSISESPAPVTIDMSQIFTAFDAAAASGLRKVRLTLGNIELRRTGERFRHGSGNVMIYIDGGYRGYVSRDNVFHLGNGRVMGPTEVELVRAAVANPRAAAATHGHDTGYCSCCRRLLTDPPSVMAGIGPVCIRRFGWSF